jgi:transcriptional regulator of met regulon
MRKFGSVLVFLFAHETHEKYENKFTKITFFVSFVCFVGKNSFQGKPFGYMIANNSNLLRRIFMKKFFISLVFLLFCPVFLFAQTATPTPADDDVVKISTNLI